MTTLSDITKKLPHVDLPKISLPKIDLPRVDLKNLPKLPSIHSIDLTHVDIRRINADAVLSNPVVKQVTDIGYTAVGFAVLGLQKAQVRRRELMAQFAARRNTAQ